MSYSPAVQRFTDIVGSFRVDFAEHVGWCGFDCCECRYGDEKVGLELHGVLGEVVLNASQ